LLKYNCKKVKNIYKEEVRMNYWDDFDCEVQCEEVFDEESIKESCEKIWEEIFGEEN